MRENNQLLFLTLKQFSNNAAWRTGRSNNGWDCDMMPGAFVNWNDESNDNAKKMDNVLWELCLWISMRIEEITMETEKGSDFVVKLAMNDRWWMWETMWIDWFGCRIFYFLKDLKVDEHFMLQDDNHWEIVTANVTCHFEQKKGES